MLSILPVFIVIAATLAIMPAVAQTTPTSQQLQLSDVSKAALNAARKEIVTNPIEAKAVEIEGQPAYEISGTNTYEHHVFAVVSKDGKVLVRSIFGRPTTTDEAAAFYNSGITHNLDREM